MKEILNVNLTVQYLYGVMFTACILAFLSVLQNTIMKKKKTIDRKWHHNIHICKQVSDFCVLCDSVS